MFSKKIIHVKTIRSEFIQPVHLDSLSLYNQPISFFLSFFPSKINIKCPSYEPKKAAVAGFNLKSTHKDIPSLPQRFCFLSCKELFSPQTHADGPTGEGPRRGHNAGSTVAQSAGCEDSSGPYPSPPPPPSHFLWKRVLFFSFYHLKELKCW